LSVTFADTAGQITDSRNAITQVASTEFISRLDAEQPVGSRLAPVGGGPHGRSVARRDDSGLVFM